MLLAARTLHLLDWTVLTVRCSRHQHPQASDIIFTPFAMALQQEQAAQAILCCKAVSWILMLHPIWP